MAVRQPDNPPKGAVRGDWFRDQSGQIWVFQDYGGWATTRREGIGKDLTSVYEEQLNSGDNNTSIENTTSFKINVGTLKGRKPTAESLRWPMDTIGTGTDYVFFQFGKYPPPFGRDEAALKNQIKKDTTTM